MEMVDFSALFAMTTPTATKPPDLSIDRSEDEVICETCDKPFKSRSLLKRHERDSCKDSTRKYHCLESGCSKSFKRKDNLRRHEKKCHADGPPTARHSMLTAPLTVSGDCRATGMDLLDSDESRDNSRGIDNNLGVDRPVRSAANPRKKPRLPCCDSAKTGSVEVSAERQRSAEPRTGPIPSSQRTTSVSRSIKNNFKCPVADGSSSQMVNAEPYQYHDDAPGALGWHNMSPWQSHYGGESGSFDSW